MRTTETVEQNEDAGTNGQNTLLVLSATLFIIVCIVSTFLFIQNRGLDRSIEANRNDIVTYTNSIEKIKSDKKIVAAELVTANKSEILETIRVNEVQKYITEVLDISRNYKLLFSGFSYKNGKISTSAVSIPETVLVGDDGVKKISHLVRDYRTGTGYIFQLAPVLSISGYEQKRSFSLEFNV